MHSARVICCIVLLGLVGVPALAGSSDRALKVIVFPNPPANLSASIFYNDSYAAPVAIPLEDLAHQGGEFAPDQVHLSLWTPTTMHISWATGLGRVNTTATPPTPYDPDSVQSIVEYGIDANALTMNVTGTNDGETSKRVTYNYVYNAESGPIDGMGTVYESPILHHVLLSNLTQGQQYFYRFGDPTNGFSEVYNFTVPENKYPFTIGVLADPGQTYNSSETYRRLAANKPSIAVLVGDLSYADTYYANGTPDETGDYPDADYFVTYQPRWDSLGRMTQDIWSSIPLMTIGGNHELESQAQNNNVTNVSFNARYPMPRDPSVINTSPNNAMEYWDQKLLPTMGKFLPPEVSDSVVTNNTWYSIDAGPVHIIMLNNYVPYGNTSAQYKWLEQDLANVNRTATPWVLLTFHSAIYHSYVKHYKENDEMRMYMEPLWFKYGVDIVANGHVHAYERSPPVYEYEPNSCGPIYLTIGDGGNVEGLYKQFVDQTQSIPGLEDPTVPAFCGNTSLWSPASYQPSYSGDGYIDPNTPFCYASQPPWSDFRDPSFGHGTLEFINATAARWRWNRNIDTADEFLDDVTIVKNSGDTCNDKVVMGTEKNETWDAEPYEAPSAGPSSSPTDSPSSAPAPAPAPGPGSAPPSSALSVVSTWATTMVFVVCALVM